jgi:hypothetical protein
MEYTCRAWRMTMNVLLAIPAKNQNQYIADMVEDFYSNRYKVVDAEYVAEELKKVTLKQIELTNKIIKTIT